MLRLIVSAGLLCLLYLLLYIGHLTLPGTTKWDTLDEAKPSKLTQHELTNDYWRYDLHAYPAPDYELLAIARADYTIGLPILSQLFRPTHGHKIHYRIRIRDERLRDQLLSAVRSYEQTRLPYGDQPAGSPKVSPCGRTPAFGPMPTWWHPKYYVDITKGHESVSFGFDPEEPDIAYTTSYYEWSPISGD